MGKSEGGLAARASAAQVMLSVALGSALLSLPLWAGKMDSWRQWLAAALALGIGAWALAVVRCGRLRGGLTFATALLVAALMMTGASVCPGTSARIMMYWAGCAAVLLAAHALAQAGLGLIVISGAAAGAAITALWSVREYLFTALAVGDYSWRPFGPFVNPNALAGYMLAGVPAMFALAASLKYQAFEKEPGHPVRLAFLFVAALTAVGMLALIVTGSKGALLAGAVALVAVVAKTRGGKRAVLAALAVVLLAVVLPPVRNRITAAFSTQRGTSLGFRIQTWLGTWDMAKARPLVGWGPGCFTHAYPRFARVPFTSMAHFSWLQVAAESGLPVALLFTTAFVLLFADCLGTKSQWGPFGGFAMAGLLLQNVVDYTLYLPAVALTALAVAGTALGDGARAGPEHQSLPPGGRGAWPAIASLTAGMLMSLWFAAASLTGAHAEALVSKGFYLGASRQAEIAACRAGFDRDLWVQLGKIREGLAGEPPDAEGLAQAADAYRWAAVWAPTDPAGYIGAARCYRRAGKPEQAVAWSRRAAEVYPNGPPALLEYARCLEQAGDVKAALDVYRRIAALADGPYGQYPALEGWADYRIAIAAAAVARSNTGEKAIEMWRRAGQVLVQSLSWSRAYRSTLESTGRLDVGLDAELDSLAMDTATALSRGGAGDRETARKLRELAGG